MKKVWFGQVAEKFSGLVRLGLVWSCCADSRILLSADREQMISTQWPGVQWEPGTIEGRRHRGLQSPQATEGLEGLTHLVFDSLGHRGYMQTVWGLAKGVLCSCRGRIARPRLRLQSHVQSMCSGPVAGEDFTRCTHPYCLSFPAHAGNCRKGAFCNCLSSLTQFNA